MNYIKIFSLGNSYMESVFANWCKRKDKLISRWAIAYKANDTKTKSKCIRLIDALEIRIFNIREYAFMAKEERKRQHFEQMNTPVRLECPAFKCRLDPNRVITVVMYEHYEDGKHKCENCGTALEMKEAAEIEFELIQLGIHGTI